LCFAMAIWSEAGAITHGCLSRTVLCICASVLFAAGIWQNVITRRIDAAVLHDGLVE
jgi:hypothetical protein